MKLHRYKGNPILSPYPGHPWEDLAVFNPAAWYDEKAKEVLLLYRAAESGPEYKCYFGLAKSKDGFHFERVSDQPVLSPSVEGFDGATIQDPRMIKMDGWYCVTYAARHFPFGQFWIPEVKRRYERPDCPVRRRAARRTTGDAASSRALARAWPCAHGRASERPPPTTRCRLP